MSAVIPNLWPTIQTPDVMLPVTILRQQASLLRQSSKGILEAEVCQIVANGHQQWWTFFIIATQLDRYRIDIFRMTHANDYPYPVKFYADGLLSEVRQAKLIWALQEVEQEYPDEDPYEVVASTQEEFLQILGVLLGSKKTRSVIESLLARTNDLNSTANAKAEPAIASE